MIIAITVVLITFIVLFLAVWCDRTYKYWQRHGIPYIKPLPFIGTLKNVLTMKKNVGVHISDIYNDPKFDREPVVGIYMLHKPALLIREPELIKSIFIKNFHNFRDRYANVDVDVDPFGALNIFMAKYKTWSKMRSKFSPTFTSGKLKQMFPLMIEVSQNMEKYLLEKGDNFELQAQEMCGLFTTDQISTIAYGIQTHSFDSSGRTSNVFALQNENNIKERPSYKIIVMLLLPQLAKFFRVELFTKKYQNFLRTNLNSIIEERKKSGIIRNDLIDSLIELRQEAAKEKVEECDRKLYDDMLLAQPNVFNLAGYETTILSISYTLYLLAMNPPIQKRLREEIKILLGQQKGIITYESLKNLQYLDMVLSESLRLYPAVPYLERVCTNNDVDMEKFSLKPYHNFEIQDGTPIFVSVLAMHRDPNFWSNPEVFDPERFAPDRTVPSAYMPFGVGPHNCIGSRLALIEAKLGLVYILKNFEIQVCAQTPKLLTMASNAISLTPREEIVLKFSKDVL